ncbi:PQQ-binding-like beta-propeller repeat protein [Anatilimnocola sp. NA78]|uniref:outer membrane protein assembly factor BamB family protein n=1 Tax=Anatilimnocola sp. NA78 TaxID=3415683 RepID=UPI003CE56DD0
MTDQELLQLLDDKMPEELTLEEIELLQRRLAESPALREALAGQIHFESYLQTAMARLKLSPAAIAARARAQQPQRSYVGLLVLLLLIAVPAIGLVGFAVRSMWKPAELAENPQLKDEISAEKSGEAGPSDKPAGDAAPSKLEKNDPRGIKPAELTNKAPENQAAKTNSKSAVPPPLPWQAMVESQAVPPKFEQVAFERFDLTKEIVRREQLQPWFESAPDGSYRLHEVDTQFGKCAAIEGRARLKSPWLADSFLRMSLENYHKLQIHLYHGNQGVTLVYYQDQSSRWVAYTTTRKPKTAKPDTLSLTSSDDFRCHRTEMRFGGPLDLRYHNGQVILSRGDIVLVSAPLAGPPDDVYFEGRATFYALQLLRSTDAPLLDPPQKIAFETDRPGDLKWTSSQPEVLQPKANDDGSLTFVANNSEKHLWCWTPLPQPGLQQVVVKLKDVTPGCAVYLGRKGHPNECIRLMRNTTTNRPVVKSRWVDNDAELSSPPFSEQTEPCANPETFWLKIGYGCGTLRWWISSDGKNWGQPDFVRESVAGGIDSLGLSLVGKRKDVKGTIERIELRELAAISNLVNEQLQAQAVAAPTATNLDKWKEDIFGKKPVEVSDEDWRIACAVSTLGSSTTRELGYPLLEMLLDEPALGKLPVADQLAIHADAMQLVGTLKDGDLTRVNMLQRIANVGAKAFLEHQLPPWSTVRRTYMNAPIHTPHRSYGASLTPLEPLVRTEILQGAYSAEPTKLLDLCEQLRFFHVDETVPMISWAEAFARRESSSRAVASTNATIMRDGWRPLLVEELSKETYNLTSELQAVLESEAWDDAARIITSVDHEAAPGVAPYVKDRQLLTSLPVAVQLLLNDYPQLRTALGERYGPLAKLRIGQAIAAADATAVELATVQFGATSESAEALRWLGDRALSNGWFEEAIVHYQTAITRHPAMAGELAPRIRLAGAMLGRDLGTPATNVVQFNELKLDAAAFESLVAEMRARGTSAPVGTAKHVIPGTSLPVPPPTQYAAHQRSRLDGPTGERPQEEVGRKTNQYSVPWVDKQLSATVEGERLYVTNRFQVAAYDLNNGQRKWQSETPKGSMQKSQDFALIAMRPLVLRDQILARQLYNRSQQIVSFNKADGKIQWSTERGDREFFCSDPVYLHGQIIALSLVTQEQQEALLRWNVIDPATGELQQQRDLIRLRNTWGARACCEILPLDHQLIVTLGGVTLALDGRGQVGWVRKQVTIPSEEDPRWVLQDFQRPLLVNGKVIIAQPGTRTTLCLDPATGVEHWETLLPDIVGCWGASRGNIIARTEAGVIALDAQTGKQQWFQAITDLQPYALVDDSAILVAQRVAQKDKPALQLVWLDPEDGSQKETSVLGSLSDTLPRLGPLVPHKDRLFTFFGRGQHDPNRDVVELVPTPK